MHQIGLWAAVALIVAGILMGAAASHGEWPNWEKALGWIAAISASVCTVAWVAKLIPL